MDAISQRPVDTQSSQTELTSTLSDRTATSIVRSVNNFQGRSVQHEVAPEVFINASQSYRNTISTSKDNGTNNRNFKQENSIINKSTSPAQKGLESTLRHAALNGKIDEVQKLIKNQDLDINAKGQNDFTALILAAKTNNWSIVKLLIEQKSRIHLDLQNKLGFTALIYAAIERKIDVVKLLIKSRADVHVRDVFGHTALILAAEKGYTDIVKLLIESGADIDVKDKEGCTALKFASIKGHTDTVKLLIESGADIDIKDNGRYTALIWAVQKRDLSTANLLISYGAKLDTKTIYGATALKLAIENKNADMIKLLEKAHTRSSN